MHTTEEMDDNAPDKGNEGEIKISFSNIQEAAKILRILNHPLRQKILLHILKNPDIIVSEIYRHFNMEQTVASMHLADLRRAGVVVTMRRHRNMHYRVKDKTVNEISRLSGLIKEMSG